RAVQRLDEQVVADALVPVLRSDQEQVDRRHPAAQPQLRPVRHGDHRENLGESRRVMCDKALHFRMLDHPGDGQFLVTRGDRPAIGGEQPERGVPVAALERPDAIVLPARSRRLRHGHAARAYFFATRAASSASITCMKESNGIAPTSFLPLMKKVGVPLAPTALPAFMSAWMPPCSACESTALFHLPRS